MSLRSLKKIKEPPLRDEQYSIKERAGELRGLEKERDTLAKEIKKLSEIFFHLEEGEKKVRANVEGMTTERLSVISNISKEISNELEEKGSVLRGKSEHLDKRVLLLEEMFEYIFAYAQIAEAKTSLNERTEAFLKESYRDSLEVDRTTQIREAKAKQELRRARRVGGTIDAKYEKADEIARWFEREAEKERNRLDIWAKALKLREKKVAAEKRAFKRIDKKQDDRWILILDREEMLSRTMSEIRIKENAIIEYDRSKERSE